MHGLIHIILKDFVLKQFGHDPWAKILRELNISDDEAILDVYEQYEDATTVLAVTTAAKVLGVSFDDALRAYGAHFVGYVASGGYLRMLLSMGDDLAAFLRNVNHLHHNLERKFREAEFPVFHVEEEDRNTFCLSYSSSRALTLAPLVEGVLPAVGEALYRQHVVMTHMPTPKEGYLVTWRVSTSNQETSKPTRAVNGKVVFNGAHWHAALVRVTRSYGRSIRLSRDSSSGFEERLQHERRSSSTTTVALNAMIEGATLAPEDKKHLDTFLKVVRTNPSPGEMLMRAVPAGHVAADWDSPNLSQVSDFWATNAGDAVHYWMSMPASRAKRFVTHSWGAPTDWHDVMGQNCLYADVKATELATVAKDLVGPTQRWQEVTFWIDKCCIPQRHPLMNECVALLEDFIQMSDGMVVLLTWQYFSRLWCVYEWAAFLVYHEADKVQVCVDAFLRPSSRHLFIDAVRHFSVKNSQCYNPSDRAILADKIEQNYNSEEDFERFAKGTAVAVLAVAAARRAGRSDTDYLTEFAPWKHLADEMGFEPLSNALSVADPVGWRRQALMSAHGVDHAGAVNDSIGKAAKQWQKQFSLKTDAWFRGEVLPALRDLKHRSVRLHHLDAFLV
jgi:hypothetical protein